MDATAGLVDLIDTLHRSIARGPGLPGRPNEERNGGLTGLVYGSVRGVTRLVGRGLDAALASLGPALGSGGSSPEREAVLAALNGVLGDHLEETGNPLAIRPSFRVAGRSVPLDRAGLLETFPAPGSRLAVFVHGLCMNDLQWRRDGHDHSAALTRDTGVPSIHFHYNTGRHVSENGRELARHLEALREAWPAPLEELALVGHSMGGLVIRSACHEGAVAGHRWVRTLRALVTLGTPHHGAPLERIGNWVGLLLGATPYAAPFARLGRIRSAGVTDLRYGNLVAEDWEGRDRFQRGRDTRRAVPLPEGVPVLAVAALLAKEGGGAAARFVGDGLVPLSSALGKHRDPTRDLGLPLTAQRVACGLSHLDLLGSPTVYGHLRDGLAQGPGIGGLGTPPNGA